MKGWLAWAARRARSPRRARRAAAAARTRPRRRAATVRARCSAPSSARPAAVSLEGGTLISTCVRRSLDTGQIQTLGFTYLAAANSELRLMPHSDAAALQLGFLVGAVRRGANKTNGVQLELVRRLDQVAGVGGPPGPRRAAYRRGMAAGEDHG